MRRSRHPLLLTFLRRVVLGLILPILVLLALRLFWGWEADHRLAALRSRLLAEGIRLDYTAAPVLDDQNAALAVIEAARALSLTSAEKDLIEYGDGDSAFSDITWTDAHKVEVRRILAKNADVFRWVNTAAKRPATHWPATAGEIFHGSDRSANFTFHLAKLEYAAAICAHADGHERETLDDLRLTVALARLIDQEPAELSHLIAVAIRARVSAGVERLGPDLRLSQTDGTVDATRRLLDSLADTRTMQDSRALAWEAEIGQKTTDQFETIYPGHGSWWIRPLLVNEAARTLISDSNEVPSVRADNWQAARSLVPTQKPPPDFYLNEITLFESPGGTGVSLKYSELHFRSIADSGAASILLAARLYEFQTGHLPAKLEYLIPAMLPRAPVDPFAADHRPMRYRIDPTGPTVWSVGNNGTDEEGSALPSSINPGSYFSRYSGSSDPAHNPLDIVYGAARRLALAAAASRPPPRPAPKFSLPFGRFPRPSAK